MIKAVFFDWFNTLAIYHPPREALQSQAIQENGYCISAEELRSALFTADKFLFDANVSHPLRLKTKEEQKQLYARYETILLTEAGIDISDDQDTVIEIYNRANELFRDIGFALYDDVMPVLQKLKELQLTTGLITNIEKDMKPVCKNLGVADYLDVIVTSGEARSDKPEPGIFLLALKKAGVSPEEAVHVGDQYSSDIKGARGTGIKPVMIDRDDNYPEIRDCPRIKDMRELFNYL